MEWFALILTCVWVFPGEITTTAGYPADFNLAYQPYYLVEEFYPPLLTRRIRILDRTEIALIRQKERVSDYFDPITREFNPSTLYWERHDPEQIEAKRAALKERSKGIPKKIEQRLEQNIQRFVSDLDRLLKEFEE
jgi:hypothetical protein